MSEQASAPGFFKQLSSFHSTFWWGNWMEIVERFAYYGLRTVVPIYMVLAFEDGGPQFSHTQKGQIFAVWALVQSFVPIFTGGFADRYGYKLNIAISTVVKILGYLVMCYAIQMGAILNGSSMAEVGGAAGGSYTYPIFFTGAILLAAGTAIFKPGVQGLIANAMPSESRSFGWGIFYMMVNIGGFIGPLVAAVLQMISWEAVFLICAGGIALNFIPLFLFAEPKRTEGEGYHGKGVGHVLRDTVTEFVRPRVLFFTLSFAGFWLMFYQLFDILPNFIDDWIDSGAIVASLKSIFPDNLVPVNTDGNLNQAWMINLDAFMIILLAWLFGFLTGKFKSLPTMIVGIGLSAITIYMLGMSMNGWWTLLAIGMFSIGEMVASPTKLRYMNDIAPKGKEGLFLGFANATVGIGWFVGSLLAGNLYENGGDKVNLALQELSLERDRPALVELMVEEEIVDGIQGLDSRDDAVADDDKRSELGILASLYRPEEADAVDVAQQAAHAMLLTDPKASENLDKVRDAKIYPRRLSKALGIPAFDTNLLLVYPGLPEDVDLPQLQERLRPLWDSLAAADEDLSEKEKEKLDPLAGLLRDEDDELDQAAAALWLMSNTELPATHQELMAILEKQVHVPAAGLEDLKTELLTHAEEMVVEDGEEEANHFITSTFQRTRVMEMASVEVGMEVQEFKLFLWEKYEPYSMWLIFALIGVGSGILLMIYDWGVRKYDEKHPAAA